MIPLMTIVQQECRDFLAALVLMLLALRPALKLLYVSKPLDYTGDCPGTEHRLAESTALPVLATSLEI